MIRDGLDWLTFLPSIQATEAEHAELEEDLVTSKKECATLRLTALDSKQGVTSALKDRLQAVQEKNKVRDLRMTTLS